MPKAAISFGLAGLIPFISMAALPYTFFEVKIPESALLAYGAIILSFLGGLLWGMALNGGDTIRIAPRLLTVGVITSLITCMYFAAWYLQKINRRNTKP